MKKSKEVDRYRLIAKYSKVKHVRIFFYFLALFVAFILYASSINSCETVEEFVKMKQSLILIYMACIGLLTISTVFLFLFTPYHIVMKIVLYIFTVICLGLIYIWNQGAPQPEKEDFEYGYFASRGVILTYYSLVLFLFCIFYPNLLLYRHFKKFAKIFWGFCCIVGILLAISTLFQYSNRVQYFRKGLFGESLDESLTKCRADDNTFLISHYLPRFFFHPILLTYWCHKDAVFTEIVEDFHSDFDDRNTRVKIDLRICKSNEIEIQKIPSITKTYYSYEEMRSFQENEYPYFSKLQYSIRDKSEYETIKIGPKNKHEPFIFYDYDSGQFETIFVNCVGKKLRNFVTSPKRFRVKDRELGTLSKSKPNIIVFYMDSLSRKDFERALKKSMKYIESISQFSQDEEFAHVIDYYQFFNYKSSSFNTYKNTQALFLGIEEDNNIPIFEHAKSKGYVTVLADSLCNEWSTMYNHVGGLDDEMYICDYVHVEPTCDEMYYADMDTFYHPLKGSSGSCRRCLFQKEAFEMVLDYGEKIERLFPNTPKWMYLGSMDAHEVAGESINYIDEHILKYLKFLHHSGALEKSVLIFVSDHGNIIHFIQNMFKEGEIESKHPCLGLAFPKGFLREDQKERIRLNQHRLVSHYDVHKTMMDLIGGVVVADDDDDDAEVNKYGINLFDDVVPYERSCQQTGIPENHICDIVCKQE